MNAVAHRFATTGELPKSERLRILIAKQAFRLTELQLAISVNDDEQQQRIRLALITYFRGFIGEDKDAPPIDADSLAWLANWGIIHIPTDDCAPPDDA
jgi:hypothetical protein